MDSMVGTLVVGSTLTQGQYVITTDPARDCANLANDNALSGLLQCVFINENRSVAVLQVSAAIYCPILKDQPELAKVAITGAGPDYTGYSVPGGWEIRCEYTDLGSGAFYLSAPS